MVKVNGQRENSDRFQRSKENTLRIKRKATGSFIGQAGTCIKEILKMTKDTVRGK
jgi:hypothetical protein